MRALRSTRVVIGDQIYEITPLPAKTSLTVLTRLSGVVAAGLGTVRSLSDAARAGASFLGAVVSQADDELVGFVASEFAKATFVIDDVKGTRVPLASCFETQFAGYADEMVQWLRAALTHEFGPLAEWVKRSLPTDPPAAKAPSP